MPVGKILYAIGTIPGADLGARQPHALQSQEAARLADALRRRAGPVAQISKSHSRAMVAAACAAPPVTALGIDLEWMAPNRPFAAILRTFWPTAPDHVECHAFYRVWTFLEAYYKAHQRWPEPDDINDVLTAPLSDLIRTTPGGSRILQKRADDNFQMTVLWQADAPCDAEELK